MTAATLFLNLFMFLGLAQPAADVSEACRDRETVEALARYLVSVGEFKGAPRAAEAKDVVLGDTVSQQDVLVPCSGSCLKPGRNLPAWAQERLIARNAAPARSSFHWPKDCPSSRSILLVRNLHQSLLNATDPSRGELRFMALGLPETFRRAFPTAQGWVIVYLPGYSPDGSEAVVRAWIGPSPHGTLATALLRRGKNGWEIEWCDVIYFG